MKQIIFILTLLIVISVQAQDAIKKVIVETYYVSDSNDAKDTIGGYLEGGSKTYRIYIQMKPGYQLTKLYGDLNHALKIASTANFFNNIDRGQTFGKDFKKSDYNSNTVALDTWLTLGQTAKLSSNIYLGTLKSQDNDGSFIGGSANNDGGSTGIANGLLNNNDSLAGIPLTVADGMALANITNTPTYLSDNGFKDPLSGEDSTIFGSLKSGKEFVSNNAALIYAGVVGANSENNQVLVAQLTTKGDITFELNVEIKDIEGTYTRYVAQGIDTLDEKHSGWLKYPFECGCKDANYFEFDSHFACSDQSACKTLIVLGCMDPNACNYNANANYNIQSLCCYPGMCSDRDISLVCPSLAKETLKKMSLYPNPANNTITLQTTLNEYEETRLVVYNSYGNIEIEKNLGLISGSITQDMDISKLTQGLYLVHLFNGNSVRSETFLKF